MTPEQLGYLVLGLVALGGAFKLGYEMFIVPHQKNRDDIREKELSVMKEMSINNIENLKYQKEIVKQLTKLNTAYEYETKRVSEVEADVKAHSTRIGSLDTRVSVLESGSKE